MRLRPILLSLLLVGGSVLAVGGLNPDLFILIALIGGVIIVLDWANKPHQANRDKSRQKLVGETVTERHKGPSITRQAALVGGIIGVIHGVVVAVQFNLMLPVIIPLLPAIISSDPRYADLRGTLPKIMSLVTPILSVVALVAILLGALMGCVLGVLFVSLRDHIPGSSILRKSLVFSLILLTISFILSLRSLVFYGMVATIQTVFLRLRLEMYATMLIEFPLLGCLFGFLLDRKLKHSAQNKVS